jgi:fructose-bisphosphate aldolase class II
MPLVPLKSVLGQAALEGYAVGAFNVINLDFAEAILETATSLRSPVILSIAELHFPFVKLENICPALRDMAARASVPVVLSLDHGKSLESVKRAIANGFTAVMIDGSALDFEGNVALTSAVVEVAAAAGVSVEAELGCVLGHESPSGQGAADPGFFTDVDQARHFVHRTRVDALAVAVGNAHGRYKMKPRLDFPRIEGLARALGIPLVLHGGSGLPDEAIAEAIRLGIRKVNYYTEMAMAAFGTLREKLLDAPPEYGPGHSDYPLLFKAVKDSVAREVASRMIVYGSAGKARGEEPADIEVRS